MDARIAALKHRLNRRRGRSRLGEDTLTLNLSFVLHERSDSRAVGEVSEMCLRHAERLDDLADGVAIPATVDGEVVGPVDHWVTASIGLNDPVILVSALGDVFDEALVAHEPANLTVIDSPNREVGDDPLVSFFRAPASIQLPRDLGQGCVGVAGLVLRPDGKTSHLCLCGTYAWPGETAAVVRAVERLVQSYADQWQPTQWLWAAPAEILLPGEIR